MNPDASVSWVELPEDIEAGDNYEKQASSEEGIEKK